MRRFVAVAVLGLVAVACGGDEGAGDAHGVDAADAASDSAIDAVVDTAVPTAVETQSEASDVTDVPDSVVPRACTDDGDCVLACAAGRCAGGTCTWAGPAPEATGCVIDAPGTAPTCVAIGAADPAHACFQCNPDIEVGGFGADTFAAGFEAGTSVQLEVQKVTPSLATWSISTRRAGRGASSLYFGDAASGSYEVGERAAATATTAPLEVAPGYPGVLTFWLWAETEQTLGFDRLRVLLVWGAGEGAQSRELWTSDAILGDTRGVFVPIAVPLGSDLPAGARIAFEADTGDERINQFEGFYLDDVHVFMACCDGADSARGCDDGLACTDDACGADGSCTFAARAECCQTAFECDDGDACTDDVCPLPGEACAHTARAGCCTSAADCNDANACTEDVCADQHCKNAPICCVENADCDDGDACTAGTCSAGQCRYAYACCAVDADCDDAQDCTIDACQAGGLCTNAFSFAPGCCIPDVQTEHFDSGTLPWTLSPAMNNIGWRLHANASAKSGTSVLYYGHPTLGFYESGGRNQGSATSPRVRLPDGVSLQLVFWVSLAVEGDASRDKFQASLVVGANGSETVKLVDKSELTVGSWQEVVVDVSWAAGQFVQVRLDFDTVDGVANTGNGVSIDDVRILSSCIPRPCDDDSECTSRASCVTGKCVESICTYGGGC